MFRDSAVIARNVHSQVADRIGALIVRGDVLPGDPLPSEVKICEMLDVSRTVVREAIRTLTGKGLVESRAKSGTRVRPRELAARAHRCRQLPCQDLRVAQRHGADGGGARRDGRDG